MKLFHIYWEPRIEGNLQVMKIMEFVFMEPFFKFIYFSEESVICKMP